MLLAILCLLALSTGNDAAAFPSRVDDVTFKFIVNVTSVLFPPSRISLHLCTSYDETIELSREMSRHSLVHGIRNSPKEFNSFIYDNLQHQNLYLLDLDCDYAIETLQQADSKSMFIGPTKWLLLQDRRTVIYDDDSAILLNSTYDDSILEMFEDLAVYPDSDVVVARRFNDDFFELISIYRPSPQRGVIWENRGNWTIGNGLQLKTYVVASARRRDLQRTALKSAYVIQFPDSLNHLTDFKDIMLDPSAKAYYVWVNHLANRMNATISFKTVDIWGYLDKNGSWNGIIAMLIKREIDIACSGVFMTQERLSVVQFIHLYLGTRMCFMFRRPLLSTVANIFTLPFHRNVWIAIAVFICLGFCMLYLSMKLEYYHGLSVKSAKYWEQFNPSKPTIGDNILVLLGAFAQQGYSYEPCRISSRIVTFMLLVAALSLYTSYTANIVALLQSTTNSIQTVANLLHSPLTLGVHNTSYNRHYFKTLQDPLRKAIMKTKIEPRGEASWMSIQEGMRRVQNELFAFHTVESLGRIIIQDTFLEEEKCDLTEIDYYKLGHPLLIIPQKSPYLEIIKNGALKLREYGLMFRDEHRLFPKRLRCQTQANFTTISLTECYFVLIVMGYGMLVSVLVLILELLWHKMQSKEELEQIPSVEGTDVKIIEPTDARIYTHPKKSRKIRLFNLNASMR